MEFLQHYYRQYKSLEDAFVQCLPSDATDTEAALRGFHDLFFSLPYAPERTRKHIATPARKSSCKRLNMFLRWMVRSDTKGVDFGHWSRIRPAQLMIPLDVHVANVATRLGLLSRTQRDWQAVAELTQQLRTFDPDDPVKYDFALFGMGVLE
ncbi:MAG: TIGR02757 family protein [Saprospiraceae bacterium]